MQPRPCEARWAAKEDFGEDARVLKALSAGEATSGGFLLAPEFSAEVIELLRPMSVVRSLEELGRRRGGQRPDDRRSLACCSA